MDLKSEYLSFLLFSILLLSSCANRISLTGGSKDITPPQINILKSTPNFQLRFEAQEIVLEFDEFINFSDPSKNIVISPPLLYSLDIKQRGKKITIKYDPKEVLKADVTYIINFGESIADFTENNILKNFSFVYSTGDYIDSLSIGGQINDAYTKEPVKNMTIMLYDNLEDSVVYKQRPFYFTKTDDQGKFKLNNLRSDTFKIVAIEDLNLNYLYEENAEKFSFLMKEVIVNDTTHENIKMLAFKAKTQPLYQDGDVVHDGLFSLKFDQKLDTNPVKILDDIKSYMELDGSHVKIFVQDLERFPLNLAIQGFSKMDTISIRRPQTKDRKDLPALRIVKSNVNSSVGLHPLDTLSIEFNLPLDTLNRQMMNMANDAIYIDENHLKKLVVISSWEEGQDYSLSLDSSAILDFYGRAIDSTGFNFEVGRRNGFGQIDIKMTNLSNDENYIFTLFDNKNETVHIEYVDNKIESFIVDRLDPGGYVLEIIRDSNGNNKWDSGDYIEKRQPEILTRIDIVSLESNRTLSQEVDFNVVFLNQDTVRHNGSEQKH
ncbi:MAG: Ig-like domain-containing protein [Saprospiraceae bacterium]